MAARGAWRKGSLDMRKRRESNGRATPRWGEMGGPNREATELLASRIPQVLLALGNRSVHCSLPSAERTCSQRWGKLVAGCGGRWWRGHRTDLHLEDPVRLGRQRHLPRDVPRVEA